MAAMDDETARLNLRTQPDGGAVPRSAEGERPTITPSSIRDSRFKKEMELIRLHHEFQLQEHSDGSKDIVFLLSYKFVERLPFIIHLSKDYPFVEPQYTFNPPEVLIDQTQGFITRENSDQKKDISELMGPWSPGMRLSELASKALQRIEKTLVNEGDIHKNLLYRMIGSRRSFYLIIMFSLVLRLLNGLGGYSGENDPPNYGDFEAHRNWMSLTYNRPSERWYHEPALMNEIWWRLDYPPFAGYLSYFFALFMKFIVPEGLAVRPGFESASLRLFMRMTVIASDLIFFYMPVLALMGLLKLNQRIVNTLLLLILCLPGFILVDHGHFQYNCVMLGLVLAAYISATTGHEYLACTFFSIALSTKQMSMYYALGFFGILLGKALFSSHLLHPTKYVFQPIRAHLIWFVSTVFSYAWVVLLTTVMLWLPWISYNNPQLIFQPLTAIFPVHRGLYQLKVANFWCVTDVFMKWEVNFSRSTLLGMAVLLNIIFCAPSVFVCILTQRTRIYLQAMLNISLAFFFFSYHVHEKTVLVPLLFVCLNWKYLGKMALDFILFSSFSMYHLMRMDGQTIQYFALNIAYWYFGRMAVEMLEDVKHIQNQPTDAVGLPEDLKYWPVELLRKVSKLIEKIYYKGLRMPLFLGVVVLHLLDATVEPPQRLPYLIHLLFATLAFSQFCVVFVYSNLTMVVACYDKIVLTRSKNQKAQ